MSISSLIKFNFILFLLLVQSCTVRLISEYDEITDQKVTALQETVSEYFISLERALESPDLTDENHKNYSNRFDEMKLNLSTLEVRAASFDKNRIVKEQVKELSLMISDLEKLHKIGFTDVSELEPLKNAFNSAFTAIIKLQIALKRGEKDLQN